MTNNSSEHVGRTGAKTKRRRFLQGLGGTAIAATAGCMDLLGADADEDGFGEPGDMTDDGVVTIRFWPSWGGFYEAQIEEMVEQFEREHDDIEIDLNLLTDYRDSRTTAFTNLEGGDPAEMPDITHFDTNDTIVVRDTDWFQPVEDLLETVGRDELLDAAAATSTVDDTLWAAPFYISNVVMHYNADLLADAGLDPDDPPASLEELSSVGEEVVAETDAEYAATIPNDSWFVESWVAEQDEFWLDNANGHDGEPSTVFSTEEYTMDVVEWWAQLAADDLYFNAGIEEWGETENVFLDGRAPFNLNSSTSIDWVDSEEFDVRTAQFPTLGGDGIGHSRGGAELWVVDKNRSEEEREAVRTFLEFLLSPEQQAFFHKESGYYPAHSGSWEVLEDEGWFDDNPRYETAREQIEAWESHETNAGLLTGENPAITDELTDQLNEIFGGADPESAMETVKDEAEVALSRYQRRE